MARFVAVIRHASSRSSKTSSGSASSSRTLTHADEFVAQPAYTAGAVASRASRSSWLALSIARFSWWLTHAKPLPLNVMLVELTPSFRTTSSSSAAISTSWEEESAPFLLTAAIVPQGSDRLPGSVFRVQS
jgi:hypothetical protein